MLKTHRKRAAPASLKRKVPRRLPNKALRTREHLTEKEVERLIKAANDNRNGHRDATMLLMAFRHGLRASEVCDHSCRSEVRHLRQRGSRECWSVRRCPLASTSRPTRICCAMLVGMPWLTRAMTHGGLQAYLAHRYIQHTVRYTELSSERFRGWWKD
jgi:hypothetical protein